MRRASDGSENAGKHWGFLISNEMAVLARRVRLRSQFRADFAGKMNGAQGQN